MHVIERTGAQWALHAGHGDNMSTAFYCLRFFLPRKKRWFVPLVSFSLLIFIILRIVMDPAGSKTAGFFSVSKEMLALDKCPACFGINFSLCNELLNGNIQVLKNPWALSENTKGVSRGLWNGTKIVVKHLGREIEFKKFEVEICSSVGIIHQSCDVERIARRSFLNPDRSLESLIKRNMDCPSDRLISYMTSHFTSGKGNMTEDDTIHLTTSIFFNHEPLILQVFSADTGWPFPRFYGACGRVIVVEDAGQTLESYLHKPWGTRVHLALNILKLAYDLTVNINGWALYLTDPSMENFAVDNDLEVKVIDLEHIIVVDLRTLEAQQDSGEVIKDRCPPSDPECLSFIPDDLCSGKSRDHNYYAVCRGVLADVGGKQGLLHSPPTNQGTLGVNLQGLLNDCVTGHKSKREDVVRDLKELLFSQQIYVQTNN